MKHIFYLSVFATTAIFFSCKKENQSTADPVITINSKDPVALSKSIKVWHGTRLTGKAPSPVGGANAPVIEAPNVNVVHSFAGKFAIVKPAVTSGNVAGYYVGINGAGEYFKVDYTKPRKTERHLPVNNVRQPKQHGIGFRPDSTGGNSGYIDSAIVITLPPNFQTPDTFCVTYCAYDALGNVSAPVTSCIVVSKLGGDATTDWINGEWRLFATKDSLNKKLFDTIIYNKWTTNNNPSTIYYCNTIDSFGKTNIGNYCNDFFAPCKQLTITDSGYNVKSNMILDANGGMIYTDSAFLKLVNIYTSACSSFNFDLSSYNDILTGGWSVVGDKIIILYEFNDNGTPSYEAWENNYQKISNNEFIILSNDLPDEHYSYVFKKM